ncbi:MAG: PspC domain-containing protein [Bacteroidales bacterium]|nr:PspC domain-containing protein [Bacteroidales bacterium]
MKKAIKINLSGIIFHIDDDAYEKLKAYLDNISRHFSNKQESKEIIDDIESRIAELFQERITAETQVITVAIVNEVIDIMGNPEDFADSGEEPDEKHTFHESYSTSKRLYRNPENSVVGGICGGLAAYFGIDPVIFRLLFVIFFFAGGASILVYVILWIVLPKAETAAQKLEMRGEKVNVSNLEKKIREEYENVKDNVKENVSKAKNSDTYKKTERAASDFFGVLGKILLLFVKVILIIIGTSLVIGGIGILIGLITLPFVGIHMFPFESYNFSLGDILIPFTDPVSVTLLVIAVTLLILIPIAAMLYGLVKLIFNLRSRNRGLGLGALTLWIVCLLLIIGIVAFESSHYSDFGRDTLSQELVVGSDTLVIKVNKDQEEYLDDESLIDLDDRWFLLEDAESFYGRIDIDIERTDGENFVIEIEKKSKGRSRDHATENASNIDYNFRTRGNTLVLDPYFSVDLENKWRFPRVEAIIRVPEGKVVVLDHETRDLLEDVRNVNHLSDWNMAGKSWKMTGEGLEKIAE